jgi:hypothetical protein
MSLSRSAGLLIVAWVSATAALSDVRGVSTLPVFTAEEVELINRDSRLILATKSCPWRLRHALDIWHDTLRNTPGRLHVPNVPTERVECSLSPDDGNRPADDGGRAGAEGPFDLLQILKEAAGQGTSRVGTGQ